MKNNKGFTLIEMLTVFILLGIFIPLMLKFTVNLNKVTIRAEKAARSLSSIPTTKQHSQIEFLDAHDPTDLNPIICFQDNKPVGCTIKKPCNYVNGVWQNQNKSCNGGILAAY